MKFSSRDCAFVLAHVIILSRKSLFSSKAFIIYSIKGFNRIRQNHCVSFVIYMYKVQTILLATDVRRLMHGLYLHYINIGMTENQH